MSGYRITQRSIASNTQANLQASISRSQVLQNKLSSGREISRPSDSPAGTVSALQLRSAIRRSDQLLRNADDAKAFLNQTDTALSETLTLMRRARDLALRGVNDTMNQNDRAGVAVEIDGLRAQALALANSTYLGQPLFAGTMSPAER